MRGWRGSRAAVVVREGATGVRRSCGSEGCEGAVVGGVGGGRPSMLRLRRAVSLGGGAGARRGHHCRGCLCPKGSPIPLSTPPPARSIYAARTLLYKKRTDGWPR